MSGQVWGYGHNYNGHLESNNLASNTDKDFRRLRQQRQLELVRTLAVEIVVELEFEFVVAVVELVVAIAESSSTIPVAIEDHDKQQEYLQRPATNLEQTLTYAMKTKKTFVEAWPNPKLLTYQTRKVITMPGCYNLPQQHCVSRTRIIGHCQIASF